MNAFARKSIRLASRGRRSGKQRSWSSMELDEVGEMIQTLSTIRSAFAREALELGLKRHAIAEMEKKRAEGYARHPVASGEFAVWEAEQDWGAS